MSVLHMCILTHVIFPLFQLLLYLNIWFIQIFRTQASSFPTTLTHTHTDTHMFLLMSTMCNVHTRAHSYLHVHTHWVIFLFPLQGMGSTQPCMHTHMHTHTHITMRRKGRISPSMLNLFGRLCGNVGLDTLHVMVSQRCRTVWWFWSVFKSLLLIFFILIRNKFWLC